MLTPCLRADITASCPPYAAARCRYCRCSFERCLFSPTLRRWRFTLRRCQYGYDAVAAAAAFAADAAYGRRHGHCRRRWRRCRRFAIGAATPLMPLMPPLDAASATLR